jgi:hypothetical protein
MRRRRNTLLPVGLVVGGLLASQLARGETVALWLFDEQVGIYPSCVLGDAGTDRFPLVIGPGGRIVAGKFGNALEPVDPPPVDYSSVSRDGIHWTRYPRLTYIEIGKPDGLHVKKDYIAHGMVRRGDGIWQYYMDGEPCHSPWDKKGRGAM